jgi:hypothetical protein
MNEEQNLNIAENQELNIAGVINWADFNEKKPNYGDLIVLRFPPEAMTQPIITTFDRDTQWLDGDVYAVIEPCL